MSLEFDLNICNHNPVIRLLLSRAFGTALAVVVLVKRILRET
jgi:hypothetical protein